MRLKLKEIYDQTNGWLERRIGLRWLIAINVVGVLMLLYTFLAPNPFHPFPK